MNKLLVALLAGAFAIISSWALADQEAIEKWNRMTPEEQAAAKKAARASPADKPRWKMSSEEAKAARERATATWAEMTPEQQAAAMKAARHKKLSEATALDELAQEKAHRTLPRIADPQSPPLERMGDFRSPNDPHGLGYGGSPSNSGVRSGTPQPK